MFSSHGANFGEHYIIQNVSLSLCAFLLWGKRNREDKIIDILSKYLEGELVLPLYALYTAA